MAIKNILIHLSHDGRSPARQDLAVGFARQHEARLTVSRIPADETAVIGRRSIGTATCCSRRRAISAPTSW